MNEAHRVYYLGLQLYRSSLNNTPNCRVLFARMDDPKPGDLVIEVTHRPKDPDKAVGWLVELDRMVERFDPSEPEPREVWYEKQTFINRLDGGGEISWSNCRFVAIPDGAVWESHYLMERVNDDYEDK